MPYKDKNKQKEYFTRYLARICFRISPLEQGIFNALQDATKKENTTPANYAKQALIEKLTSDGYLKEPEQQEQD